MRRFLCLLAFGALVVLPLAALSARALPTANGTLEVRDGDGMVFVFAKGAVIGTLDRGKLVFIDPDENDTDDLVHRGCDIKKIPDDSKLECSGKDIRFRIVGGRFKLRITGDEINLSAVGTTLGKYQRVEIKSDGDVESNGEPDFDDDGDYKLNDDAWKPLPGEKKTLSLGD